jgi:hypothetical protein
MSPARDELHRILTAVIEDLQRDGYAVEQIGATMTVIGMQSLFGNNKEQAIKALDYARRALAETSDREWMQ